MAKIKNIITDVKSKIEREELKLADTTEPLETKSIKKKIKKLKEFKRQLRTYKNNKKSEKLEKVIESIESQIANKTRRLSTMCEIQRPPYIGLRTTNPSYERLKENIKELERVRDVLKEELKRLEVK